MTYYTMGNPDRTRRCALVIDPSRWLPPDREPRAGAAPVEERFWDGKWTRETRAASLNVNGCRIETSVTESADYPTVTNSVTRYDFLGRVACVHTPAFGGGWLAVSNFYDGASYRLLRVTRTGQPDTFYAYDELDALAATALDVDGDGVFTAADLATTVAVTHEQDISGDWWRVTARTHSRGGVTNGLGVTREQVTGLSPVLLSRTVAVGADSVTTTVTRAFEPDTEVIATVSQADPAAPSVRRTLYGRELEPAGLGSATLSGYDGFARVVSQTVTNGTGTVSTSMIVYDTLGNAVTNATTYGSQTAVSATGYDSRGRAVSRTDALGNTVFTAYDSLGTAVSRSGAIYPVQYAYDSVGRMTSLATTRNGGAWDVTQWRFDPHTGLATNKVYADDSRIGYTYTSVGKPLRATWARGEWREHAYNADGLLATTAYSDATPAVSLAYDAFQRLAYASNSVAQYSYANSALGAVTNETLTVGGEVATLTRGLDDRHRLADISLEGQLHAAYSYDVENRISGVTNAAFTVDYAYTSDGWDTGYTVTLTNGTVLSRNLTRDQHRRSLTKAITNAIDSIPLNPLVYGYDLLNRVASRNADSFGYNTRSELASAITAPSHTNRHEYDNIGNNLWMSVNTATNFYSANLLNQYTRIANGTVIEPEYDLDGNMTWDGRFSYTWDAGNRLTAVYSNSTCIVSNAYDHMSRRVLKVTPAATHSFVYDGWNLIAEVLRPVSGVQTTNRYVWGRDLSGSLQGAGGVGGLLAVSRNGTWYFPFYDNNGNVTAYVDEHGTTVALYTYDAFGCTLSATGPLAEVFCHRFSTKYFDAASRLYYYGYRFYSPELMRWLNRDPISEKGGRNIYEFCQNNPICHNDYLGMRCVVFVTPTADGKEKEVSSASDVTVFKWPMIGLWGSFHDHDFEIEYSWWNKKCCKIKFVLVIHINEELISKTVHSSGEYVGYLNHFVENSKLKGGTSRNPIFNEVLAHERAHAKAYFDVVKSRIEAEFSSYCDDTKYKQSANQAALKTEISSKLDEILKAPLYLQKTADYANKASVSAYDTSGYEKILPPVYPAVPELEDLFPAKQMDYVWRKEQ